MHHRLLAKLAQVRQKVGELEAEVVLAQQGQQLRQDLADAQEARDELGRAVERQKAELRRLRRLSEFYRLMVERMPLALQVFDLKRQKYVYKNPGASSLLGYSPEQLEKMGSWFIEAVAHPDDYQAVSDHLLKVGRSDDDQVGEHEFRLRHANGDWRWLLSRDVVLKHDSQGRPSHALSAVMDITTRKLSEQDSRDWERLLKGMLERVPLGLLLLDREFRVIWSNTGFRSRTGFSRADLEGMDLAALSGLDNLDQAELDRRGVLHNNPHTYADLVIHSADGDPLEAQVHTDVGLTAAGDPLHLLILSPQPQAAPRPAPAAPAPPEETSDTLHALAVEKAVSQIQAAILDNGGLEQCARVLLSRAKEVTGSRYGFVGVMQSSQGPLVCPAMDKQVWELCRIEDKDGGTHQFGGLLGWVVEHREPVMLNDLDSDPRSSGFPEGHLPLKRLLCVPVIKSKEILGQIAVAEPDRDYDRRDLDALVRLGQVFASAVASQRRKEQAARLETQIQQAQKMEAIGAMADGIANDFNNLLQSVNGYAEILLLNRQEGDPGHAELTEIIRASSRATALIRQLLAFSRRFETNLRPVDLNHLVRQLKKTSFRLIPEAVSGPRQARMEVDLEENLDKINADPVQMEQVLANLLMNAVENCQEDCHINIGTGNVTLDQEFCSLHLGAKPGEFVQLVFSDNGKGMDRATRKRIFEPFFTTKAPGQGSGMGLAMVYGIVKSHDGYITCDSELGLGTTFNIYLPAIKSPSNLWDDAHNQPSGGHETILVVDDEEGIRVPSAQILEANGYKALTAASGESALDIFRHNPEAVDLVLLDLAMPGMGGAQCLKEMLAIHPETRVIIVSGYLANTQVKESLEAGAKAMIAKPYQMSTLLRQVRAVLDA